MGSVQLGDHFSSFDAGIFGQGLGNDFQSLGKFLDSVLIKACTGLGGNITCQLAMILKIMSVYLAKFLTTGGAVVRTLATHHAMWPGFDSDQLSFVG